MIVLLLIFLFSVLFILYLPGFIKKKMWKELIIFTTLLFLGFIYTMGIVYKWPLPNPTKRMEYLFEPISKALEKIMIPSG